MNERSSMRERRMGSTRERGASVVEMAFVAIFLFVLTAGIIDLGRAYLTRIAVHDAAQEGLRGTGRIGEVHRQPATGQRLGGRDGVPGGPQEQVHAGVEVVHAGEC